MQQWAALRSVILCSKHQCWSLETCALVLSYATGYELIWEIASMLCNAAFLYVKEEN